MKAKESRKGFWDVRMRMLLVVAIVSLLTAGVLATVNQLHTISGDDPGGGEPLENVPPVAEALPEYQEVEIGESAWFYGNLSYDPDGFIVNYTWDFGDGEYGFGVLVEHSYDIGGEYNVTLWVYDNEGLSDDDTVVVLVKGDETNPVILAADPPNGAVGVPLDYSITVTFSEEMDPSSLSWTINPNPGEWDEVWSISCTVLTLSHSNPFLPSTLYTVEIVEAKDISGNPLVPGPAPNPWEFLTVGENIPPVAVAIPDIQWVFVGEPAWFDGNLSYDPDGLIVDYLWDFGDGTTGKGVFVLHAYGFPGNYSVKLTVTDDGGATSSDWVTVIVQSNVTHPFIIFTYPYDGQMGVPVYENIGISFSEPMNTSTVTWTIDPDPGCWNETWLPGDLDLLLTHCNPFEENTWYTVHVVSGESKSGYPLVPGPAPNPWSFMTEGENLPPVAIAFPDIQWVFVGDPALFHGLLSYDPDGFIVYYFWDFGDGTFGEGPSVVHVFDWPGNYTVTLTVHDNENASSSDTCIVIVEGGPGLPDLSLTGADITLSKEEPAEGEVVWIYANVHNIGFGGASNILVRFVDCYANCSFVIGETYIDYLSPGSSQQASIQWVAGPMGNHTIIVIVDPLNYINETDETNNLACKQVFVLKGPPYEIFVEAYTFDNDGDGICDDVTIIVYDNQGHTVEGALVYIDGSYFADTPQSGVLLAYNLSVGRHEVQVHFETYYAESSFIV